MVRFLTYIYFFNLLEILQKNIFIKLKIIINPQKLQYRVIFHRSALVKYHKKNTTQLFLGFNYKKPQETSSASRYLNRALCAYAQPLVWFNCFYFSITRGSPRCRRTFVKLPNQSGRQRLLARHKKTLNKVRVQNSFRVSPRVMRLRNLTVS